MDINLLHGDCLIESDNLESGSVDLILTDLPYGNMDTDGGRKMGIDGWVKAIPPKKVYEIANRILRKNGKMILFSQEPYTTQLINETIPNVPFSYRAIWEKDSFANALGVNKNMIGYYEDILIFSKIHDTESLHPLRMYSKKLFDYLGVRKQDIQNKLKHQKWVHFFQFDGIDNLQYGLCTESTYDELIQVFGIDKMQGFKAYAELKLIDDQFKKDLPSTFNLWEGNKYKSNILKYKKDYGGLHPTQKPILLLEDLIKTFSNEGDLVVDLTMGSGSTAVACINTNRNFIGIELDDEYFEIAKERIADEMGLDKPTQDKQKLAEDRFEHEKKQDEKKNW